MVRIACRKCDWEKGGLLGYGGLSFSLWDKQKKHFPSRQAASIQRKLDVVNAVMVTVGSVEILAVCENCRHFDFKSLLTITHATGKITQDLRCPKCRCAMQELTEDNDEDEECEEEGGAKIGPDPLATFLAEDAKCPKCTSNGLELRWEGIWD